MMPFTGGVDATPNATLIFSIVAAIIYGFSLELPPSLRRTALKLLPVLLLALLSLIQGGPLFLVAALALSATGDAFLSRQGERAFLGGLGCFLVAHLLYIALFARSDSGVEYLASTPLLWGIALAMVASAVGFLVTLRHRLASHMKMPVTAYILVILATGIAALTTGVPMVIGGVILFMASDGMLAAEKFIMPSEAPHRVLARYGVWVLYYAGQLAITLGVLLS